MRIVKTIPHTKLVLAHKTQKNNVKRQKLYRFHTLDSQVSAPMPLRTTNNNNNNNNNNNKKKLNRTTITTITTKQKQQKQLIHRA
jgi:hypothetical protein